MSDRQQKIAVCAKSVQMELMIVTLASGYRADTLMDRGGEEIISNIVTRYGK
jgi:hypothetical protein